MINIILADDHQIIRQAIGELLESSGRYRIIAQVSSGKELLQALEKRGCDVIVIDIAMPLMDGISAVKAIRDKSIVTPVLALSANDDSKSVKSILQAGANGFVPKTSTLQELDFAINSILRGNGYLSPSISEKLISGSCNSDKKQNFSTNLANVLTNRELEIMKMLVSGTPNRLIGKELHISTRTVDTHRSNILKKLNVKTNAELVKIAIMEGLISM